MSFQSDREQFNNAINNIVQQATTDATYRSEMSVTDVVGFMKQSGISEQTLAELLKAEGLEESEVQGFNLGAGGGPGSSGIIIGTICVGTCRNATIVVDCTRSIRPNG